jgi:hypothetical protein
MTWADSLKAVLWIVSMGALLFLFRCDTRLAKRLDPHEALNYAGAVLIPIGFFIVWLIFRENCRSR